MNKRDISAVRRRLAPDKNNISTIRLCYVNEKKEIISQFTKSPLMMPENEAEKYFSIFKRTLAGTPGKNTLDIRFTNAAVESGEEYKLLADLRSSALKDDELVGKFFTAVINSVNIDSNYIILLMHDVYDVPSYSADGSKNDISYSQFSYIMCSICPVKTTKSSLVYDLAANDFKDCGTGYAVASPSLGFMFPAFEDRGANIYSALFFTHDTAADHSAFTNSIFHAEAPMPASVQKETFQTILVDTLEDDCSYDVVQTVRDELIEMIDRHEADRTNRDTLMITKNEMKAVLESSGVSQEHVEAFDKKYDESFGAGIEIPTQNLIDTKQFELRTPDVVVKVNPEKSELVTTRTIDGIKYVMIRADSGIELNGMNVKIPKDTDQADNK